MHFVVLLLLFAVFSVLAQNGTQICVVGLDDYNCVQLLTLTVGSKLSSATQLSCFGSSFRQSFTWGWSIDPVNELAWIMGVYPQTQSYRQLVAMEYNTGEMVALIPEGPAESGTQSPYYFAADPSTGTMYAVWETSSIQYPIVEVNLTTGVPIMLANFTVDGDVGCTPAFLNVADIGQWDAFRRAYVTPWYCSGWSYLARYYVDSGKMYAVPVAESPDSLADFGVNMLTGATYAMISTNGGYTQQVFVVGGTDLSPSLLLVMSVNSLLVNLIALPDGVCVVDAQNDGAVVSCQLAFDQNWTTTIPQLAGELDNLVSPQLVRCPDTL